MQLEYIMHEGHTALVLPVEMGDILWYTHLGRLGAAKVYEMKYTRSDGGHCLEDLIVFAYDPKHGRNLTWCPIHDEGWLDARDEYVTVYRRRADAERALGRGERPDGGDLCMGAAADRRL